MVTSYRLKIPKMKVSYFELALSIRSKWSFPIQAIEILKAKSFLSRFFLKKKYCFHIELRQLLYERRQNFHLQVQK